MAKLNLGVMVEVNSRNNLTYAIGTVANRANDNDINKAVVLDPTASLTSLTIGVIKDNGWVRTALFNSWSNGVAYDLNLYGDYNGGDKFNGNGYTISIIDSNGYSSTITGIWTDDPNDNN